MGWLKRIGSIARRGQPEHDLNEEIEHHIELKTQANIEAGMSPKEARYAALRAFGGVEQKKEEIRDADRLRWVEDLLQDVRYGLRQLRRNPGFATVAVLAIALGVGVNTGIFSLGEAILFPPFTGHDASRLAAVYT
ncbi:MAG: permease prefix domain 1-containing protein, partial [Terriglobia bacterium]